MQIARSISQLSTPTPAPGASSSEQAVLDGFRADRMLEQVQRLGGPRVAGTADAKRAAELIREIAASHGWDAHVEHVAATAETGGKDLYNVVADHRGTAPDGERQLVLAGAHLDSVRGAYGANDDASGSAALLEGTRVFSEVPTAHDLRFIWFDGEEDGMVGSHAYVDAHRSELKGARAMVVAEMIGSPHGAPKLVFTDRASSAAATPVVAAGRRHDIDPCIVVDRWAASDHMPFGKAGIPSMVVASAAPGTMSREDPNYHRPSDTPDKLNLAVLEQVGDLFGLAVHAWANPTSG